MNAIQRACLNAFETVNIKVPAKFIEALDVYIRLQLVRVLEEVQALKLGPNQALAEVLERLTKVTPTAKGDEPIGVGSDRPGPVRMVRPLRTGLFNPKHSQEASMNSRSAHKFNGGPNKKPFRSLIIEGGPLALFVYRPDQDSNRPYEEYQAMTQGGWVNIRTKQIYDSRDEIEKHIASLADEVIYE